MSNKRPRSPLPEECNKKISFPILFNFLLMKPMTFPEYEAVKEKMEDLILLTADQELLEIWKKLVHYLDNYRTYHFPQACPLDLEDIVLLSCIHAVMDTEFNKILEDPEFYTMLCLSSTAKKFLALWKNAKDKCTDQKSHQESSLPPTTESQDTNIFTSSTTVSGQVEVADALSPRASSSDDVLSHLFGVPTSTSNQSSVSQTIFYSKGGKWFTSKLETTSGYQVVEIRVASFADALQVPQAQQVEGFFEENCLCDEESAGPVEPHGGERRLAAERIGKNTQSQNVSRRKFS